MTALLLDFGGVLLLTPFELCRAAEQAAGLAPGRLAWTGPFDPAADPLWEAFQRGELTERGYWLRRAGELGVLLGQPDLDTVGMFRFFFEQPEAVMLRPDGLSLVRRARAAGIPVGVLTNDLLAFHGQAWRDRMTVLDEVDAVVDGSVTGVLKPDPQAYRLAAEALGVAPEAVLFVDDQPANVQGAQAVGMAAILFDVTDPVGSFERVGELVGATA